MKKKSHPPKNLGVSASLRETKNEDGKPALVPKLRFPEFQQGKQWEVRPLGKVAENLDNLRVPITSSDRKAGDVPYYGASGIVDYVEGFLFDEDLLCVSEDGANLVARTYPIAFPISGKTWVNNHAHVLRFESSYTQKFVEVYLNSIKLDDFITGMAQPKLNKAMLDCIPVPYPSVPEQQKIAECLSSVDELMAAQGRKVDALKTHKTGLMQQLFPREGETQPRLRFPEFQNAGEWEPRNVSQFAKVTTGAKDTQNKVEGGKYPFFVRSQTVERIDSFSYDGEAVLTSGDGVGVGKNFHHINGKFDFHQRVYCIYEFAKEVSGLFFYLYFSEHFGERVMRMSAKNSVDSVRMAMITEMSVLLPQFPEQQRIATCLSSLDALITAATQKLAALKTHKRGLMQQLFPSPEDMA